MRLGLLARADGGGLAAITEEFQRHLLPDRTLVIDMGAAGRGPNHLDRYPGAQIVHGADEAITPEMIYRFCKGVDLVYTAETFYRSDFCVLARQAGCRTLLHAMPELWRQDMAQPDAVWVPTNWELGRMPHGTQVVPVPIPRDRFPAGNPTTRKGVWYHPVAPAMLDRNGTRDTFDALAWVKQPATMIFVGGDKPGPIFNRYGTDVTVRWVPAQARDRWDAYPHEAGGMVLPRRYAGLSLPFQEAASLGWPIVASDLPPQNEWIPREGLAAANETRTVKMVGGFFPVYGTSLQGIATAMDTLVSDTAAWQVCTKASETHARRLSWDEWTPRYVELLEEAARL